MPRRIVVAVLLASLLITAHANTEAKPRDTFYRDCLSVEVNNRPGPTWRVRYLGTPHQDPRRVLLADGRVGLLTCRAHTFTIIGGPSYFVDC